MGTLAFVLFLLYDINSVIFKNMIINSFFFLGSLLLVAATMGIIVESRHQIEWNLWAMTIFGLLAVVFFCLLIYTLFFALPFDETYLKQTVAPKTYRNGVYALCRHPGVLWFMGGYFCLWLALKIPLLLWATIIFSSCNFFYIIFQDYWTFKQIFTDYSDYQKNTPFIIPNQKSIKRCLQTLQ
jgi:protein-S-isoprenylcysteine O-methyltransferase Ste14